MPDTESHTQIPKDPSDMTRQSRGLQRSRICMQAEVPVEHSYTLSRKIPAIPSSGDVKLGPILHLPAGSQVQICGEGFRPRMVKVRYHDSYYFVFQEDLAG